MRNALLLAILVISPMLSGCLEDEVGDIEGFDYLRISDRDLDSIFTEEIAGTGITVCDASIKITHGMVHSAQLKTLAATVKMVAVGGGAAGLVGAVAMYAGAESADYMIDDYCTDGEMDETASVVTNMVTIGLEFLNTAGRSNDSGTPEDGEWFTNESYLGGSANSESIEVNTAHRKGYHINVNENGELELVAVFSLQFSNGNYEQTWLSSSSQDVVTEEGLNFSLWSDKLEYINSKKVPINAGFVYWAYDTDGDLILRFTFDKETVTTVCSARIRGYQSVDNTDQFDMQIMLDIVSANRYNTPLIIMIWFELDIGEKTAESTESLWRQDYDSGGGMDSRDDWDMIPVEQVSSPIQNQDGYCRPTPWLD
jgi:hypothetical protein